MAQSDDDMQERHTIDVVGTGSVDGLVQPRAVAAAAAAGVESAATPALLQQVLVRRRRESIPDPHLQQTDELRTLLREFRREVVAALPAGTELNEATKPALTRACKKAVLAWLSDKEVFVSYGKMGHGTPVGGAATAAPTTGLSYVVTEKVHGANFSLHVNRDGRVRCAKRTAFLEEDEDFFGHFAVLGERHGLLGGGGGGGGGGGQEHPSGHSAAAALANDVFADNHDADGVILFGELFGGRYPAESTVSTTNARSSDNHDTRAVQQGIWYSPRVEWMVFDVALRTPTGGRFLPHSDVVRLAAKHGFFYAAPLLVDSYQRCLDFPVRFTTTIPRALYTQRQHAAPLPPLPTDDDDDDDDDSNLAEGIVVKPWDAATTAEPGARPILKVKIEEFSEGGGQPPAAGASGAALRAYALGLVNRHRIAAAASKIGPSPGSCSGSGSGSSRREQWAARVATMATEDCLEEVGDADAERLYRDQLYCKALRVINEAPDYSE